jgi:bleomycin hydrolase
MSGQLVRWARSLLVLSPALVLLAHPEASLAAQGGELGQILSMSDAAKARMPKQARNRAIHKYGLKVLALRRSFIQRHNTNYKVEIPREKVTHTARNQEMSGRCWIFASDRVLQSKLFNKGIDPAQLSTSFINYHALRQRSFALLREAATAEPSKGKTKPVTELLGNEGGFQPWIAKIIQRYGIVPEQKMRTTADGGDSELFMIQMQTLVASARRAFSRAPRGSSERQTLLKQYQGRVEELLDATVGKPPRQFTLKGKVYTPKTYARRALGLKRGDLDYVVLTNDPTHAWNRRFFEAEKSDYPGMYSFKSYNVSMDIIRGATQKTLKHGEAVFFAANWSPDNPHVAGMNEHHPKAANGVLALAAFNYGDLVPSAKLSKHDRVKAGILPANHAMAITGYDPGKRAGSVAKWKVDNSYGSESGDNGHLHMYDDYFRQYVETVVVPRSSVPRKVLEKLESRRVLRYKNP